MIPKFQTTIAQVLERPIRPDEVNAMLSFAKTIPIRLPLADMIEDVEDEAITEVIEKLKGSYPKFQSLHFKAYEKCRRDMKHVLRYVYQAVILESPQFMNDRLLYWLRTMTSAGAMTPKFMRDTYSNLNEALRKRLPSTQYEFLAPVMNNVIEVLSDYPEPTNPRV